MRSFNNVPYFYQKEGNLRRKLSRKAAKLEEEFNNLIRDAQKEDILPDVSIWVRPNICTPVIKIWFFRDNDAIQN